MNGGRKQNPSNKYPRAMPPLIGNVMSDVIVEDGSYIRLKEATLTYQFPKKIFAKTQLKDLQLSISGRNLLTLTGYSGYDPEVSIFGEVFMVKVPTMGHTLSQYRLYSALVQLFSH